MNFLENIFESLRRRSNQPVLAQLRDGKVHSLNGHELLGLAHAARSFLAHAGLKKGDRCVLLANNEVRWVGMDLGAMAEGIITVPLYARQAPRELVAMMKDCAPSLVVCGNSELRDGVAKLWPDAPPMVLFEDVFTRGSGVTDEVQPPVALSDRDPLTIIYTSGTSGEPKGVVLNVGNLNHMLGCTNARLDLLMGPKREPERVFHYLPFCFAGSWILLLTCLSRNTALTMGLDLTRIVDDLQLAAPHYFLNVPTLLERMRAGITEQVERRGGLALKLFSNANAAWQRRYAGRAGALDFLWLGLADALVFPKIRQKIGPNLRALICGSAPLAVETQLFFMMLGLPVLQVYGLTETTAICTMDDPRHVVPGRAGPAIPGTEMKLGHDAEIKVRGPNIFPGYWNRPEATAKAMRDGWLRTGDQGEVDESGNWRIIGRLKNLIILNSGHNIAPEPIEEMLLRRIPGAQHVMLVGNGRSFLGAIVAGSVTNEQVAAALESVNAQMPHYRKIRAFVISQEPFSPDNGLLTANGKLRRDAIAAQFQAEIDDVYRTSRAVAAPAAELAASRDKL
jgi:long-chain acyl-CoA synthetase